MSDKALDPADYESEDAKNLIEFVDEFDESQEAVRETEEKFQELSDVYTQIAQLAVDYEDPSERLETRYINRRQGLEEAFGEYKEDVTEMREALNGVNRETNPEVYDWCTETLELLEDLQGVIEDYFDTYDEVIDITEGTIEVNSDAVNSAQADFEVLYSDYQNTSQEINQRMNSDYWYRIGEAIGQAEYDEKSGLGKAIFQIKAFFLGYFSSLKTELLEVPSWKYRAFTVIQQLAFVLAILYLISFELNGFVAGAVVWGAMYFLKGQLLSKLNEQGYQHPNQ